MHRQTLPDNAVVKAKSNDEFNCGKNRVELSIPDCTTGIGCNRIFYLYIPTFLCKDGDDNDTNNNVPSISTSHNDSATSNLKGGVSMKSDVLPLVFSLHCLGCKYDVMEHWAAVAEEFKFVLVIPEGIQHSWNARYCCGYALEHNIDDHSFLEAIIDSLPQQQNMDDTHKDSKVPFFVSKDVVYGMGWSNGGYLATYAADLFRAVAPISGHQYESSDFPNKPTSLFMHHGSDDVFVRPTGCCTDPTMPGCCCGISNQIDHCSSVSSVFERWAKEVNGCKSDDNGELDYISENDEDGKITCHTATGDCLAETKYCIHEKKGHFNNPSHEQSFTMVNDIADFFARDACSLNGGNWFSSSKSCICKNSSQSGGVYCMTPLASQSLQFSYSTETGSVAFLEISSAWISALGIVLLFVSFLFLKPRSKYEDRIPVLESNED